MQKILWVSVSARSAWAKERSNFNFTGEFDLGFRFLSSGVKFGFNWLGDVELLLIVVIMVWIDLKIGVRPIRNYRSGLVIIIVQ